ncbi:MAG: hypothetical protein R3C49_13800 [Planctomycetaceae bacterium]
METLPPDIHQLADGSLHWVGLSSPSIALAGLQLFCSSSNLNPDLPGNFAWPPSVRSPQKKPNATA